MITLLDEDLTPEWYNTAVRAKIVGCDIETSGLDKNTDRIATFQMYVPEIGTVMVRNLISEGYPKYIVSLMENKRLIKVFHYATFDLGFLMRDYYYMFPSQVVCTKIAADLVDRKKERYIDPDTEKGSHSLKALVYHHFGYKMDKSIAVSDWFADELDEEQLIYAAKDVEYLPELFLLLREELAKNRILALASKAYDYLPTKIMLDLKAGKDIYSY